MVRLYIAIACHFAVFTQYPGSICYWRCRNCCWCQSKATDIDCCAIFGYRVADWIFEVVHRLSALVA